MPLHVEDHLLDETTSTVTYLKSATTAAEIASNPAFLEAVSPAMSIIKVGANNDYVPAHRDLECLKYNADWFNAL